MSELKLEYFRELFDEVVASTAAVKKLTLPPPIKTSRIVYGRDRDFIPRSIFEYIEKTIIITYKWRFVIGKSREYNIHIGMRAEECESAESAARAIYAWLLVADKYAQCNCSQKMDIYIYMTDLQKRLPERSGQVIGPENVNTAFTTSCKETTEIHLFREEEWFKVLIHETFHNLGLDFSGGLGGGAKAEELMRRIFCIKTDFLLHEAYTETFAEIIATMFDAVAIMKSARARWSAFRTQIAREQKFSVAQVCKILNYMGLSYRSLSCNDMGSTAVLLRKKYREESAVFSYYVVKSILMFYIDDFTEWCTKHNENTLRFAGGSKTQNAIVSFCDFIRERHMGAEYLRAVDVAENARTSRNYMTLRMRSIN